MSRICSCFLARVARAPIVPRRRTHGVTQAGRRWDGPCFLEALDDLPPLERNGEVRHAPMFIRTGTRATSPHPSPCSPASLALCVKAGPIISIGGGMSSLTLLLAGHICMRRLMSPSARFFMLSLLILIDLVATYSISECLTCITQFKVRHQICFHVGHFHYIGSCHHHSFLSSGAYFL